MTVPDSPPAEALSHDGTVWCESCQVDGLYPTHACERVQADLASIRLSQPTSAPFRREAIAPEREVAFPCHAERSSDH